MKPIIIIPAYQPNDHLVNLINDIFAENSGQKIIVVDDGSTTLAAKDAFAQIKKLNNVDFIAHEKNMGKGEALKTAFNFYLKKYSNMAAGVVTADADGQHLPKDIFSVADNLDADPTVLWIGARLFKGNTPFRSRIGNFFTRGIFNLFFKGNLSDTQSGLRGIPNALIEHMIHEPYKGYDFELDMLAYSSNAKILIKEIPIETIYIDKNISSHFNPLLDSIKIYFVFIRFSAVSLISAALDYGLFSLFFFYSQTIFFSIISARIISAVFNFCTGKLVTFKSKNSLKPELIKYSILAVCLVISSYLIVKGFVMFFGMNVYFSKIISETILFITSFTIQRLLIF